MTIVAQDTFVKANVASGWGTATDGHTWTERQAGSTLSVSSNEGLASGAAAARSLETLGSLTNTDGQILFRFKVSSITNQADVYALCRYTDTNNYYWLGLNWVNSTTIQAAIRKRVIGTNTTLSSSTFAVTVNTFYWIKAVVQGSALSVKIWQDGSSEPGSPTLSTTDTALTSGTLWGLAPFTGAAGVTVTLDSLSVDDLTPLILSDTGSGSDSLSSLSASMTLGESGSGVEALVSLSASMTVADSGTGAEALVVSIPIALADSGHGADSLGSLSAQIALAESGGALEALLTSIALVLADGAVGADALAVSFPSTFNRLHGTTSVRGSLNGAGVTAVRSRLVGVTGVRGG